MTPRGVAVLLALPLAGASLQGCWPLAAIGAAGTAAVLIDDRRPTFIQLEDQAVEVQIGEAVAKRFGSKVHVNPASFNRAVLLTGEAPDAPSKAEIEKIALGTPNVHSVTNEIEIAGVSSLAARSSDALLTGKVRGRFLEAGLFNPLHVKVVSEAGVVYLMGVVTEKEAEEAVEIARTTAGVRKVVKIFQSCRESDEICRPAEKGAVRKPGPAG